MKKFIWTVLLTVVLFKSSFVCADTQQLKCLAGKKYRDVPAQNETNFSKEYMNVPYELFHYNEHVMTLVDSDGKQHTIGRCLWDESNDNAGYK